jgi:hypothetical protein
VEKQKLAVLYIIGEQRIFSLDAQVLVPRGQSHTQPILSI